MTLVLHPHRWLGTSPRRLHLGAVRRGVSLAPIAAGLTTAGWYAFGMVPVQVAAASDLGLTPAQATSLLFVVWVGGAIASLALALGLRQPIAVTSSTPALLYLVAMSDRFPLPELMGAGLIAGLVIIALGLLGAGERVLTWLPLPLAMGMFAGSLVGEIGRLLPAAGADGLVVGATVAGYLVGRVRSAPWAPPIGLAAVAGGIAILLTHQAGPATVAWTMPQPAVPPMGFSLPAMLAVSLPLVVLAMGLGHVQGAGFLIAQGYRAPMTLVTVVVGVASVGNALLGGHSANLSRIGIAMLAGPEAGPKAGRYWAAVTAAALMLLLGVAAGPVVALLDVAPQSYVIALGGLALLAAFQDALGRALGGGLRRGALTAFVVAAVPFAYAGLPAPCWALAAALAVSLLFERDALCAQWRSTPPRRQPAHASV